MPRCRWAGLVLLAVAGALFLSIGWSWAGWWVLVPFLSGTALFWAGVWWLLGPDHAVLWWPWRAWPTVYGPNDASDEARRARAFVVVWKSMGLLLPLRMAFDQSAAFVAHAKVAAYVLRRKHAAGVYYEEPSPGVRMSTLWVATRWLYEMSPGRSFAECHRELRRRTR